MKKLLVLGGTKISCEIVKKAKDMGLYVAVLDYNPPEHSPAKQIADESFLISAADVDGVVELIRREHFDGVITGFADVLLPYYAEICQKTGLPSFGTKEQFDLFTDKNQYKELLLRYEIPTPIFCYASDWEKQEVAFPVMIKPVDSSGARGCIVCHSRDGMEAALKESLRFSKKGDAIIEEYITGPEVTAFFVIQDGEAHFAALGNRHVENHQGEGVIALPVGYTYPSNLTASYMESIAPKMQRMLEDQGIRNGMLFAQCIVSNGVPMVYDLGLRLTGSLEYYMLEHACGYNTLEMMIRFAMTGSMGEPIKNQIDPFLNGQYGWNISALLRPGKIAAYRGLENMSAFKDLIAAVPAFNSGDELTQADKGLLKQIGCRFIGASATYDDMKETVGKIEEIFDVLDPEGESLLLPTLNIEKYKATLAVQ